jgi:hypothetical protein
VAAVEEKVETKKEEKGGKKGAAQPAVAAAAAGKKGAKKDNASDVTVIFLFYHSLFTFNCPPSLTRRVYNADLFYILLESLSNPLP